MLILVIGKNYTTAKLADKLAENKLNIVFTTARCENANYIDISPLNVDEIKDFIIANEISLLILADQFYAGINYQEYLYDTECCSFAPDEYVAKLCSNIYFGKKFAYKNKLLTSKFAAHEKYQSYLDYLNSANFPLAIKPEVCNEVQNTYIAETKEKAEKRGEELFLTGNKKIFTEEYIEGKKYTRYYLTDSTNYAFLFDSLNYFDEIGTNNTNYINEEIKNKIEKEYIPVIFNDLMEEGAEHTGIIGITFKIDKNNEAYFLKFKPFFDDFEIDIFINHINEDIAELFDSCACGEFFNQNRKLKTNDKYIITYSIENEIEAVCANTMSQAIKQAEFNGVDKKSLSEAINSWKK